MAAHRPAHLGGPQLQPRRIRTFKRSTDPDFAAKLDDVVGLYMHPPRHAVVVLIDKKSQSQALDRTKARSAAEARQVRDMTHDIKRNGTTLLAALSVLEGKVIGRCGPRHRHQEFIGFLATVERSIPVGRSSMPSSTTMPPTSTRTWWPRLADHPRWTLHFTPTSCS